MTPFNQANEWKKNLKSKLNGCQCITCDISLRLLGVYRLRKNNLLCRSFLTYYIHPYFFGTQKILISILSEIKSLLWPPKLNRFRRRRFCYNIYPEGCSKEKLIGDIFSRDEIVVKNWQQQWQKPI